MGRAAKRDHLLRLLDSHAHGIRETFQMLEQPAGSSLEKVEWSQVTKLGDEVSKQATITGTIWSEETPDVKHLEENMAVYCNTLQGFLLLCHGSTVGAGPTLLASIHASAMQVIERSLSLLREPISTYGIHGSHKKLSIPQLSGSVWETCAALKKTPTTNSVAVGRAITQVAVSMKDVLREMKELKLVDCEPADESPGEVSNSVSEGQEEDSLIEDEFDSVLSEEEMNNAQLVTDVVSDMLVVVRELIRFISGMLKGPKSDGSSASHVDSSERLLKHCQEIGGQIDELGACVYPSQELSLMKTAAEKIIGEVEGVKVVVKRTGGITENLIGGLEGVETSLRKLQSCVVSVEGDLVPEIGKLVL